MTTKITRQQLLDKIIRREELVILEALPPMYYNKAHLPGALNLPHDRVDADAPALLPDKGAQIVVYCANTPCPNSGIAARRLVELGYTRVFDYDDGKDDWIAAGLPTATSMTRANAQSRVA